MKFTGIHVFVVLSTLATAKAAWGLGWCSYTEPELIKDFNATAFSGEWKEIFIDKDHWWWSGQNCSHITYKPHDVDDMTFFRRYKN